MAKAKKTKKVEISPEIQIEIHRFDRLLRKGLITKAKYNAVTKILKG